MGYFAARQPDSERFRLWEVAGTAHVDAYAAGLALTDLGDSPAAADLVVTAAVEGFGLQIICGTPINSGPQHFVLNAAFAALNRWLLRGKPPLAAPRLVVAGASHTIARDALGNALGIRTPRWTFRSPRSRVWDKLRM